jgi:hypothetical protein
MPRLPLYPEELRDEDQTACQDGAEEGGRRPVEQRRDRHYRHAHENETLDPSNDQVGGLS